jgi:predicted PurR-regulated permease PerM
MAANGKQCNHYKAKPAQFGHSIDLKEIARSGIRSIENFKSPNQKKSAYSQMGKQSNLGYGGKMKNLDDNLNKSLDDSLNKSLDNSLNKMLNATIAILSIAVTISYFFFVANYLKLANQISCYSHHAKCDQLK